MDQTYSVVIATLGGPSLKETVYKLNSQIPSPSEVLICIPKGEAVRAPNFSEPNVRVVVTPVRGQVAQRAIGFKEAVNRFVLQIDDDMSPSAGCIASLLQSIQKINTKAAISPLLIDNTTKKSVYRKALGDSWLGSFYYWLLNGRIGYKPGSVLSAGIPVGIDDGSATGELLGVDWLPGGCVLHAKENLVTENFFPFQGKAYCEDLIHSYHLKRQHVSLYVDTNARCAMDVFDNSQMNWGDYLLGLKLDLRARKYYMDLVQRPSIRVWFFYAASLFGFALERLGSVGLQLRN